MELETALEVAIQAAQAAGEILGNDFHRPGGPRGHGDKAEADLEAETVIRARLREAFPAWGYLGEETGGVLPSAGAPVWLVDPNDGTSDYLKGRRGSAVSIGLVLGGQPVLGVVFVFAYPDDRGDLFTWAEGCGLVQRNGRSVPGPLPATLTPLDVVLVSSGGDDALEANLASCAPGRCRTMPSIAHRLALVAAGEAAAASSVFAPCAWDYGAGHALVRGAGGRLVDAAGTEIAYADDGASRTPSAFAGSANVAAALGRRGWVGKRTGAGRARGDWPARLRRGEAVRDANLLARAQGCLLGQVAGDSLGSLVEFQTAAKIAQRYPDGPRRLADGGVFDILAGQATDDSEMALALARAIVAAGRYLEADALAAYREWLASRPFDVGGTILAALSSHPNLESQANGSLMRASPLGVFAHARDPQEAATLARLDAGLTHPHPVCRDATAAFVVAVSHAIRHGDGPVAAHGAALDWARAARAEDSVVEALEQAGAPPPVCDGPKQGFVLIALRNAFHVLLRASSLEQGVVETVRRGGDTDTNAAIAGALLGAVHGREAVPAQWRQMILSCRPFTGRPGVHRPRPEIYWPVDVMEVAERLLVAGRR